MFNMFYKKPAVNEQPKVVGGSHTFWTIKSGKLVTVSLTRTPLSFAEWHAVAVWKWEANDDNCGICRMPFDGCCTKCKLPGDDCPLVWGQCTHCFHMHCIVKWLESQSVNQHCPMCRQEWKFNNR